MENRLSQSSQSFPSVALQSLYSTKHQGLFIDWAAGLGGGFASATLCAPFDIARTRHMLLATTKSHGIIDYQGFLHTVKRIFSDEGLRGLYKGYSVTAISIPTFHSLYFALFYKMKDSLSHTEMFKNREVERNIASSFVVGLICNTITNPLWVIRTRIQSQFLHQENLPRYTGLVSGLTRICKEEGFKALFKGLGASYFGLSHAVILYPLYEYLKTQIKEYKGHVSNTDIFLASLVSKFVAMVLTYPHILLRARLQDHRGPSFMKKSRQAHAVANASHGKATITSVIRSTYNKEGIKGFYSGMKIDMVRVLPANSIMFVVFEFIKSRMQNHFAEYSY